ncbi:hypothetical protein ACFQ9Y_26310 [Peribacillus simplex]|uniref:hypothetical protein n=1 Tax=Peribacillus simplex TaxID=1478 RepID=UPI0036731C50
MLEDKSMGIANFNCTFGKKNEPMLEHFESIVLPAFQQNLVHEIKGNKFHFEKVRLVMTKGEFALAGIIVKRTKLVVKSLVKEGEGLTRTNQVIPSDPYSYFFINLKNHRMALVKNQPGSPTLNNFSSLAKYYLRTFINEHNRNVENAVDKLLAAKLNVVAIPFKGVIKEELQNIKKIEYVTLRFYPLNGDILENETIEHLREMLDEVDSNSAYTRINTPKNHDKVAELLEDTKGTVKPSIRVIYKNNSKRTLTDEAFTESMNIEIDDEEPFIENIDNMAGKLINKEEFIETSEENEGLYDKFFGVLSNLFNR